MGSRVLFSIDFDGCLCHAARNKNLKQHSFTEYLIKKAANYESSGLIVGSNRQSVKVELAGFKQQGTRCYQTMLELEAETGITLDRFLLADVYQRLIDGSSFELGLNANLSTKTKNKWKSDRNKISLVYAQIHRIASQYPNDQITYEFYDDKVEIIKALNHFFTENPELIPDNVTLSLNCYSPYRSLKVIPHNLISGEGDTDLDYKATVLGCENRFNALHPIVVAKAAKAAKAEQFSAIKQSLQGFKTTKSKQESFRDSKTLQDLCFAASVRQKSGGWHPKNTTTTGNELVRLLNLPENDLLRREICPNGAEVRMRDIRSYALHGVKSESGYFLNDQDKDNEKEFAHSKNPNKEQPMLIFKNYSESQAQSHSSSMSLDS